MLHDPFEVREVDWQPNKTSIRRLTFRNFKRWIPSTRKVARPATAQEAVDTDAATRHLAAFCDDGTLIGTVRLSVMDGARRVTAGVGALPDRFVFAELSGLVLAPEFRDTALSSRLLEAAYERARALGCHVIVTNVWSDLVLMYEAFGFFRYHEGHQDPDRGFVVPMMLDLHDVAYMRLVGSPLADVAQRFFNPGEHSKPILQTFANIVAETRPPRSRRRAAAVAPDAAGPAGPAPRRTSQAQMVDLEGLQAALGRPLEQRIAAGTRLVGPETPSDDLFIIVSGTLGVTVDGDRVPVMYLREGDVVSESAYFSAAAVRPMSLTALTECVVVPLGAEDLEHVIAIDPVFGARLALDLLGGVSERFGRHLQQWRRNQEAGPKTSKFRRDFHKMMRPGAKAACAPLQLALAPSVEPAAAKPLTTPTSDAPVVRPPPRRGRRG